MDELDPNGNDVPALEKSSISTICDSILSLLNNDHYNTPIWLELRAFTKDIATPEFEEALKEFKKLRRELRDHVGLLMARNDFGASEENGWRLPHNFGQRYRYVPSSEKFALRAKSLRKAQDNDFVERLREGGYSKKEARFLFRVLKRWVPERTQVAQDQGQFTDHDNAVVNLLGCIRTLRHRLMHKTTEVTESLMEMVDIEHRRIQGISVDDAAKFEGRRLQIEKQQQAVDDMSLVTRKTALRRASDDRSTKVDPKDMFSIRLKHDHAEAEIVAKDVEVKGFKTNNTTTPSS